MRGLALSALIGLAALGPPAAAQERTTGQRALLTELAQIMGESHAYRQACGGASDQYWRNRMLRLVSVETAGGAFEAQLKAAFNDGFLSVQRQNPRCGDPRAAALARRGGQIAIRLGQV